MFSNGKTILGQNTNDFLITKTLSKNKTFQ